MKNILLIGIWIIILSFTISCEKTKENNPSLENEYYLNIWLGSYEGTSHHFSSYPDGGFDSPFIQNSSYAKVQVDVQKSSIDSCLNFLITFNDSILNERLDVQISVDGKHHSSWGGGSGYGSLDISIDIDSLHYDYFQKCGIPCSSGFDFGIARNN